MLTCVDGVAFRLEKDRGRYRLEVVSGDALLDPTADRELVNLTSVQVRKCFEGSNLERAHAVAALTTPARAKIFPPPFDGHGTTLLRIGRAITDPVVVGELADAPFWLLQHVALYRSPAQQLETVIRATAQRIATRSRRRR